MAIYGPGYRKSHKYPSQDWLNNDDIYTANLWKQQSLAEEKMRRFFCPIRLNGWAAKGKNARGKSPNMERNTVSFYQTQMSRETKPIKICFVYKK